MDTVVAGRLTTMMRPANEGAKDSRRALGSLGAAGDGGNGGEWQQGCGILHASESKREEEEK